MSPPLEESVRLRGEQRLEALAALDALRDEVNRDEGSGSEDAHRLRGKLNQAIGKVTAYGRTVNCWDLPANQAPTQPNPQPEQCRDKATLDVSDKPEQCGGSGEGR